MRPAAAVILAVLSALDATQAPSPAPTAASPSPGPAPSPSPSGTAVPSPVPGLRGSIDRVLERLEAEEDPCRKERAKGRPCFPVTATRKGPEVTVRDTFRDLGPADKPSPDRPPTLAEMKEYRPGPATPPATLVSFDPGCVAKAVLGKLRGQNSTFYLYRIRDVHGERVAMYEHRVDATTFQGDIALIGRIDGLCAALDAYRAEQKKLRAPPDPVPAR